MKTTLKFELKNGRKVSMSEETAKELYEKLNEYFGYKFIPFNPICVPYIHYEPFYGSPVITYSNSTDPNKVI